MVTRACRAQGTCKQTPAGTSNRVARLAAQWSLRRGKAAVRPLQQLASTEVAGTDLLAHLRSQRERPRATGSMRDRLPRNAL